MLATLPPGAAYGPMAAGGLACAAAISLILVPSGRVRAPAALLAGCAAGLAVGEMRLDAIDGSAYRGPVGAEVRLRGFVTAVPRRSEGEVRVRVRTRQGNLLALAPEPVPDLPVGNEVRAEGRVLAVEDWRRTRLRRYGIARVVEAEALRLTGRRRGGLAAIADRVRERAERALGRGTPPAAAALLRGFVLGQDDRIDPHTVEEFKRSGLAHLLAVSGQNVLLLALLAMPILALAGAGLRLRIAVVIGLVVLYVPVTGAGPSIQRAAVMGIGGMAAALAGRPAARWHALTLAAAVTLVANPLAWTDIGWQLSFAAVAGIAVGARPLARALGGSRASRPRRAMAEGAALTVAATLATAPLMAHHFEAIPLAALPANLLALPAVAPVMWIGMLVAIAGQLPWLPVEPLTAVGGALAGTIAQVAAWTAGPAWALVPVPPERLAATVALIGGIVAALALALRWRGRRIGLGPTRAAIGAALPIAAAAAIAPAGGGGAVPGDRAGEFPGLVVRVLDVGQGDAILLQPPGGAPVLVDAGPPDAGLANRLAGAGLERLGAVVITHGDLDHSGGLGEVLEALEVGRVVLPVAPGGAGKPARVIGAPVRRLSAGDALRSGRLRLEVLWPRDGEALAGAANASSLVLLARFRRFEMLFAGDAEAESAPLDPGPIEVLKVAHHGSEDDGLPALLARTRPRLAVISVGADNPHGHPAPGTLEELARAEVRVLRTDRDGTIVLETGGARTVATAGQ